MKEITELKIVGIDEKRPPIISKKAYIDIVFKLSHQAPTDWCNDFNTLLAKHSTKPKINEREGLYIEGWVRSPDDIEAYLEQLKARVLECSEQFIKRIEISKRTADNLIGDRLSTSEEQHRLNSIVAALDFDN